MKSNLEAYWTIDKVKVPITIVYLQEIVDETYIASVLNPGWGDPKTATRKLLVAIYTQSRFLKTAYNEHLNKNGTKDIGIAQINSCHWSTRKSDWYQFCHQEGLKSHDPGQLWDSSINILFAAWYNQKALDNDQTCYHFNRTKDQKRLYQALLKIE